VSSAIKKRAGEAAISVDWVGRAKELAPMIADAADRIEAERRVPDDIMAAMHDAEMFRMTMPPWLGGGEVSPLTAMLVLEIIGAADASAAWCLGQAMGCARMTGFLDADAAREIFGPADAILAWGPPAGPTRAVAVEGGYRVSGKWRFASGVRNATWLGPQCAVFEADGSPRLDANGKPVQRSMAMPIANATVTDVWQVLGLRGTGSDNYEIDDVFVPEAFSFGRDSADDRRETGPLYEMPMTTFFGVAFAGVALGVARSMLDDFIRLAHTKVPNYVPTVMRESPAVQREVAQAEADLGSARSFLIDMTRAVWECGERPANWPIEMRARLRLASTNAVTRARDTAGFAYQAAGSTAIFDGGPFERRFRDINTIAQQAQGQPVNMEHAGMALLGLYKPGNRV